MIWLESESDWRRRSKIIAIVAHTSKTQRIDSIGSSQITFQQWTYADHILFPDFTTGNRLLSPASDRRSSDQSESPLEFRSFLCLATGCLRFPGSVNLGSALANFLFSTIRQARPS